MLIGLALCGKQSTGEFDSFRLVLPPGAINLGSVEANAGYVIVRSSWKVACCT